LYGYPSQRLRLGGRIPRAGGEFARSSRVSERRDLPDDQGTLEDSAIASNVIAALVSQLANTDCIVRGSDARVRTSPNGLYSYADAVVSCGQELAEKNTLLNPVLIVEVLSEGTESYDRGEKFELYRQIESILRIPGDRARSSVR
jgi:Uma2 family endonuclease